MHLHYFLEDIGCVSLRFTVRQPFTHRPTKYANILRIRIGVSKTRAYIDFRKLNFTQTKPVCVYITWSRLSKLTDSKRWVWSWTFAFIKNLQTFKLLENLIQISDRPFLCIRNRICNQKINISQYFLQIRPLWHEHLYWVLCLVYLKS